MAESIPSRLALDQLANFEFQLGPLLLPFPLLLVLAAAGATLLVANRLARSAGVDVEGVLWRAFLVAALVARLAFVFEYRSLYFASPLAILDIRDGGWNPTLGLVGAWLYAIYAQRKNPAVARPLRWALATGTALFAAGMTILALRPPAGEVLPPDLVLASLDGKAEPLARFAGKPTVVNLWATWCPPCVREMPVLHAAQVERQDIHFVFINQGEDAARVRRWLHARGLPLQNVLVDEPQRAGAVFRQKGYPTTLFFDANGTLVSRRVGELSAATLAEKLTQISR